MELQMTENDDLRARLEAIDHGIRDALERVKLRSIFNKDHVATSDELDRRHRVLSEMLDSEVSDLKEHGKQIGSLEKSLLIWLNSVGFDH
jgi:hypothetical protein